MTKTSKNRHHVVIIGAGFGGIEVANQLAGAEVDVTIIDRRNHHLFQPLLTRLQGRHFRHPRSPGLFAISSEIARK